MTLFACRNALSKDFPEIIRAMEEGKIDPLAWITNRCTLHEIPGKLAAWSNPKAGVIKAVASVS